MIQMYFISYVTHILLLVIAGLSDVECAAPAQMAAPTISLLKASSFQVNFASVASSTRYHVTVVPRYNSALTKSLQTTTTSLDVSDLVDSTLYNVSVRAENSAGEIGIDSTITSVQTMPGPPTLNVGNTFPNGAFVYFEARNLPRVSQWRLEYREKGSSVATTADGGYYALWFSDLNGNTEYEIRGRALQINGTSNLSESEVDFSDWKTIKTDTLSVFGRVVLTDISYTDAYSNQFTSEWNSTLVKIEAAYSSVNSVLSVTIIRIEDDDGNPLVFYQLRVSEQSLSSSIDYTISDSSFSDSFVNNGDESAGTPRITITDDKYKLKYDPVTSTCSKLVDRYLIIAPENQATFEVFLNTNPPDESSPDESSSLKITDTDLRLDNGDKVPHTITANTVLGFVPKFLVKDCLKTQPANNTDSSYHQFLWAKDNNPPEERIEASFYTIDVDSSILNISEVIVSSLPDGSALIASVPNVPRAIKYEILNGSSVQFSLSEEDIDGNEHFQVPITYSLADFFQQPYTFSVRVTTRKQDGTTDSMTTSTVTVTAERADCAKCSANAFCVTMSSEVLYCNCYQGYSGDGVTCTIPTTAPTSTNPITMTSFVTSQSETTISDSAVETPSDPITTTSYMTSQSETTISDSAVETPSDNTNAANDTTTPDAAGRICPDSMISTMLLILAVIFVYLENII